MYLLFRPVMIAVCLLMLGISSALLIGRNQPPPPRLALLHLSEDTPNCHLPCWIGIMPGMTTVQAAKTQIARVYAAPTFDVRADNASILITERSSLLVIAVTLFSDQDSGDSIVNALGLEISGRPITSIGYLVGRLAPSQRREPPPEQVYVEPAVRLAVDPARYGVCLTRTFNAPASSLYLVQTEPIIIQNDLDHQQLWRAGNQCYRLNQAVQKLKIQHK